MFDLGFAELMVIFVLGLLVLGPKRMPVAVRAIARMVAKVRGAWVNIQNEIDRELELEKLKKQLQESSELSQKTFQEFHQSVEDIKQEAINPPTQSATPTSQDPKLDDSSTKG